MVVIHRAASSMYASLKLSQACLAMTMEKRRTTACRCLCVREIAVTNMLQVSARPMTHWRYHRITRRKAREGHRQQYFECLKQLHKDSRHLFRILRGRPHPLLLQLQTVTAWTTFMERLMAGPSAAAPFDNTNCHPTAAYQHSVASGSRRAG